MKRTLFSKFSRMIVVVATFAVALVASPQTGNVNRRPAEGSPMALSVQKANAKQIQDTWDCFCRRYNKNTRKYVANWEGEVEENTCRDEWFACKLAKQLAQRSAKKLCDRESSGGVYCEDCSCD